MDGHMTFFASKLVGGRGVGPALVTNERLGLRGFVNAEDGILTGGMGELEGLSIKGAVLVFPCSKGSTTWCMALDLACRYGHTPAAFVIAHSDPFVAMGAVMQEIPLVCISDQSIFKKVRTGDLVTVDAGRESVLVKTMG